MTARLLAIVFLAVIPPLVLLALVSSWGLPATGATVVRLIVVGLALLWAGIVAIAGTRIMSTDTQSLIALAERREGDAAQGAALDRVARLLDRRDLQLQALAAETAAAPITKGASAVAAHVALMARRVTGDATWNLAVQETVADLEAGVYDGESAAPAQITDLHRWAAVSEGAPSNGPRVADGPWGAFLIVPLHGTQHLRSLLVAPWEGRVEPSGADRATMTLIAEHAAGALDHAVLYARVRRQAEELDRLSAVQKTFLRGVTHDLQSPLASISAIASDLQRESSEGPLKDSLQTVEEQAERLRRMVSQLLTMSALEAGVVAPRSEVFRSETILARVIRSMHLPDGRVTLVSDGPDHLAVGDVDRFEQVLWAVIDNAVKYSPPASPIVITLSAVTENGGFLDEIAVTDHGIGMDRATAASAFDQFFRADRARELAPNGSGIGLFTGRALMELMDGSITVNSSTGRGTTIRLRLPAELAEFSDTEAG